MLPVEDPAFVCLVVIDDPTSKHCHPGGGTVCAPVFQKLATRLAAAMNIPKNAPSAEANKKSLPCPGLFHPIQTAAQIIPS